MILNIKTDYEPAIISVSLTFMGIWVNRKASATRS